MQEASWALRKTAEQDHPGKSTQSVISPYSAGSIASCVHLKSPAFRLQMLSLVTLGDILAPVPLSPRTQHRSQCKTAPSQNVPIYWLHSGVLCSLYGFLFSRFVYYLHVFNSSSLAERSVRGGNLLLTADYWSVSRAQAHWPDQGRKAGRLRSRYLNKPR